MAVVCFGASKKPDSSRNEYGRVASDELAAEDQAAKEQAIEDLIDDMHVQDEETELHTMHTVDMTVPLATQVSDLKRLLDEGVLSDDEFQAAKKKTLGL